MVPAAHCHCLLHNYTPAVFMLFFVSAPLVSLSVFSPSDKFIVIFETASQAFQMHWFKKLIQVLETSNVKVNKLSHHVSEMQ